MKNNKNIKAVDKNTGSSKDQRKTALLSFLLGALMIFAFSLKACVNNTENASVHIFYYTYSDTYLSSVRASVGEKLKTSGISYQEHDAGGSQTTQTEQIQTAITKGAKVIVVNLVNTGSNDAASEVISLAKNADIPVIFFNREVSDELIQSYDKCVFVGTRAEEAGILQGEMIGEYLLANYSEIDLNSDGKISYILFKGEEGNKEAIYRTQLSVERANKLLSENGKAALEFYDAQNPNKYLVDKNGQWSAQSANEYMTTALASYNADKNNMIELIICNNDGMAEGAISALNSAGYNLGEESVNIPVFGVDATDAAKSLIAKGKMAGTIKQDAEGMADAIIRIVKNANSGEALLFGMDEFDIDKETKKIRIPYAKYLG